MTEPSTIRLLDDSGEIEVHGAADVPGNYGTLCGNSIDDDCFAVLENDPKQKLITCGNCLVIWKEAMKFKRKDFMP